uniref:Major facilitator superfamily (MFS) profile domain-containing protein n=2 Tax=Lutzomyia longipalpis TaxID=7200 RepID=A0A1B0C8K7_LUTLO
MVAMDNVLLFVPDGLDRKKSLSMSHLPVPAQDRNFLCVPGASSLQELQEITDLSRKSYESLRRIESNTSITVPENFSFSTLAIQVYKMRWAVLLLSLAAVALTYMQWIQYSIVANIIMRYYRVSSLLVDWTSMVFMVTYTLLVIPVSFFMDIKRPRQAAVMGSVLLALGSWIKVFSLDREMFLVSFLGQTVVAIAQVFIVSLPNRLATTWFSPEEASKVCGLGVFGAQLGTSLGFFLTPWLVQNDDKIENIHQDLEIMYISDAGLSTMISVFTVAVFQSQPEKPPSHIQAIQRSVRATIRVSGNPSGALQRDFVILAIAYGMNVGVFNSMLTLLNQIVLNYFPDSEKDAGYIGVAIIVTGLVGSVVFGFVMDTWHEYRKTAVWVYGITALTVLVFSLSLESKSKKLLYVASILMGFFMSGLQTIGYELAAELTYPEPDGPVAGIMNISTHIFGILFTITISRIHDTMGDLAGNMAFTVLLVIGALIIAQIKSELKRHSAYKEVASAAAELAQLEKQIVQEKAPFLIFKIDEH